MRMRVALVNLVLVGGRTWPLCLVPLTVASKPLYMHHQSHDGMFTMREPLESTNMAHQQRKRPRVKHRDTLSLPALLFADCKMPE
ncbi:hypothetical protein RHGRI_009890 [Rhododendron griersonianum]|uniref:Secreted protein n=1 Tax=Rhododendron griersonianum TaxID=479676 RepID=A0AAV6KGH8_9ERIC|nr:hypothetical protein RHGRI_009890 [Rhododendron griersonianum]